MAFLKTSDTTLYFRLGGAVGAPPLVLVNSLGTDCRIWDDVVATLGQKYRILSYDLRGHGLSGTPSGPYGLEAHLSDFTALVDHVGFERFALCGVSIGGVISQGFASQFPERLSALILSNTAAKIGEAAFWDQRINTVLTSGVAAIADAIMQRWFSPSFQANQPEAWAAWRQQFLTNRADGYAATCATLRDTDLTAALSQFDKPVLVVAGSDDLATPPALVKACAESFVRAQYHELEQVGHLPSLEVPEQFSQITALFLEGIGYV